MTVRDTSALSHAINRHGSKKAAVVDYVSRYGPVTRKQIAVGLGIETSTISGLVTPLVHALNASANAYRKKAKELQAIINGDDND